MIGFLGAVIGGLASLAGTGMSSALQIREAAKNRKFQERMSSTAYQRGMKDMRLAGLNPILAYSKGGASTPSGAQAKIADMGGAATTALAARRSGAEIDLLKMQRFQAMTQGEKNHTAARLDQTTNRLLTSDLPAASAKEEFDKSGLGENLRKIRRVKDALNPFNKALGN